MLGGAGNGLFHMNRNDAAELYLSNYVRNYVAIQITCIGFYVPSSCYESQPFLRVNLSKSHRGHFLCNY
jgi:hypothetical protein